MRRRNAWLDLRRAASVCALGGCACACEGSAPASTRPSGPDRPTPVATDESAEGSAPVAVPAPAASSAPDSRKGTWVLHVGDSFVEASFAQHVNPRVRATGAGYVASAGTATYTTTWASDEKFDKWLDKRPSLVLVTLGANEVEMPVPGEHANAVERIARKIAKAGASCVWITPPMWKRDTGFLQVIHDHCAPCLFFDSDAVLGGLRDDERQRDRIHPNDRGGARWADAFWQWLEDHRDPARGPWALVPYERRG